jgi:sarcosine oxidase subunit alpha
MLGADPLLRARDASPLAAERRLTIVYDDAPLPAHDGDTVTSALLRAGIVATSRSLKYRRPRGPFCLQGDCGTCLVRIDGVPNRRACTTRVADGMRVEPQNRVLAGAPDPTALVDKMFMSNLDHHHFMVRPKLVNRMMQEVARNLSGLGTLPDVPPPRATHEHHTPDVVVIGGGRAGLAATSWLRTAGLDVECLERWGERWSTGRPPSASVRWDTAVFGIYPPEAQLAAIEAPRRVVHTFTPAHVVLATGARDVMMPLCNNDLPGVFAARGLVAMLDRSAAELACDAVVVGDPLVAAPFATRLRAEIVAPADVAAILGGSRVEAIATSAGKRDVGCVALAAPPAPASDLARQAGAKVAWDGSGFAVVRDDDGRCGDGPWQLWACGEVCGVSPEAAEDDGERIARAIVAAQRKRGNR